VPLRGCLAVVNGYLGGQAALAPVLISDGDLDIDRIGPGVQTVNHGGVTLLQEFAPQFARTRLLPLVRV